MAYPSTFVQLQNEVIDRLRLDSTADLTRVKDWINQVYTDICVETEALQDFATSTFTSGTYVYDLDSSLIRIKAMFVTPVGGTQSGSLTPVSLEQILDWRKASNASPATTSSVTHYALLGALKIVVYPTPAAADTLTTFYVKLPTALSSDSDLPVIQEPYVTECITSGAMYKAALFIQDQNTETFKRDFEQAKARFRAHIRRKQGAGTLQFRTPGTGFYPPSDPSTDVRGWYAA